MIVAAAVRYHGKNYALPAPARHGEVFNKWHVEVFSKAKNFASEHIQGFIDSEHGFVDRRDAWTIAKREGQILQDVKHNQLEGLLMSEDVW